MASPRLRGGGASVGARLQFPGSDELLYSLLGIAQMKPTDKPTITQVREALLAEAKSTEEMVAGADSGVRYRPEYLRELAASLEGMVLVPREPTEAMLMALNEYALCAGLLPEGYRAMLTASEAE